MESKILANNRTIFCYRFLKENNLEPDKYIINEPKSNDKYQI